MKTQTKLATAVVLSLMTAGVYAAPTVYGALDVSVDHQINQTKANVNSTTAAVTGFTTQDVTEVNSNNSYIGIKGQEQLTDRLSAVYQVDWTLNTDGDTTDFSNRSRFIGLKDKQFGTLKVGQQDTPLKLLSTAVDSFNNRIENKADVHGVMGGENRIADSIVYELPTIDVGTGKLNFSALTATGESGNIRTTSGGYRVAGRGFGEAISAAATYTHADDLFLVGVGVDRHMPSGFLNDAFRSDTNQGIVHAEANTVRATGRVNLKNQGLAIKGLYQISEVADATTSLVTGTTSTAVQTAAQNTLADIDKATSWLVGAEWNVPQMKALTTKLQYSQSTTSFKTAGFADYEVKQVMLGADYALSKQAKVYGQAGYLNIKDSTTDEQAVVGLGMEYKF